MRKSVLLDSVSFQLLVFPLCWDMRVMLRRPLWHTAHRPNPRFLTRETCSLREAYGWIHKEGEDHLVGMTGSDLTSPLFLIGFLMDIMGGKNLQWRWALFWALQSFPQVAGEGFWSLCFQVGHNGMIKSSCAMQNWFFLYYKFLRFWSMGILKMAGTEITSSFFSLGKVSEEKNQSKLLNQYQQAFLSPSVQVLGKLSMGSLGKEWLLI